MTTKSASALLDAALFMLQQARAELVTADVAKPAAQGAVARFMARYDALDASDYTPAEQATAYDETAGVLRRRAARVGATADALAETEARARYFEARAQHKRHGEPMPYALRSVNERLGYVDTFRRELVDLVQLAELIAREEILAFEASLEAPRGDDGTFDVFLDALGALVGGLGVVRTVEGAFQLLPYRRAAPGAPPPPETTEERAAPAAPEHAPAPATTNGAAT